MSLKRCRFSIFPGKFLRIPSRHMPAVGDLTQGRSLAPFPLRLAGSERLAGSACVLCGLLSHEE